MVRTKQDTVSPLLSWETGVELEEPGGTIEQQDSMAGERLTRSHGISLMGKGVDKSYVSNPTCREQPC